MNRKPSRPAHPGIPVERVLWTVLAGAAIVAFAFVAWVRQVEPFGMDQGLFACMARFLGDGRVPYRDLWDSKPPLVLLAWHVGAGIFGYLPDGVWTFEAVWLAGTAVLAGWIAVQLFPTGSRKWAGLFAAVFIVAGMWNPGWGGYWSRAQAEELLAPLALGALYFAVRALDRPRLALAAGVLAGLAGLFKVPSLSALGAFALAYAVSVRPWRAALERVLLLAAGAAIPWALIALWFAAHGALADARAAVFTYSSLYASYVVLDGVSFTTLAWAFVKLLVRNIPALLAFGAAGTYVTFVRRDRGRWFVGLWALSALGAVLAQRQLAGYHFLLVVPPLALLAGATLGNAVDGFTGRFTCVVPRAAYAIWPVILAALALREGAAWSRAYRADLLQRNGVISRATYLHALQAGPFDPAETDALANDAVTRTKPGDRILVWGLAPGVYALADREPATRFPFHKLFLTDSPLSLKFENFEDRRTAFMAGLAAHPPAAIYVGTKDANGFEPEPSDVQLMRFPELRTFVDKGYVQAATIGKWMVYVRR